MADDSQGNHSLPSGYKAVTGDDVLPSNHNPPLEDLSSSMTARYMRDGRAPMLGDMPMGSHKITGLADAVNDDEAVNKGQLDGVQALALPLAGGTMTGPITFNLTASASTKLIDLMQGYGIYSDNIGTNGSTRVWFDAPDDGEVIFGPRGGSSSLAWCRIRADLTTIEGAVTTTGAITLPSSPTAALHAATKGYVDGYKGAAKAWVNFDGTGTVSIRDSFNVSSITDGGVGNYIVNFAKPMANTNYAVLVSQSRDDGANPPTPVSTQDILGTSTFLKSTTQVRIGAGGNQGRYDATQISVVVFGG